MFGSSRFIAFLGVREAGRALEFYRDKLGLRLVSRDPHALVFDAGGTTLRLAIVPEVAAAPYTVAGWQVANVALVAESLAKSGVKTERYPPMEQDDLGIWTSPSGARIIWFKDDDGNLLSATQF